MSSKVAVPLAPGQRADAAAAAVLRRLLEAIRTNLPGTLEDLDPEFLHDLRVAVRRSRSIQRELKGVFPPRELEPFRREFGWLQQITGEARDLDVYVSEFDDFRVLVPAAMRPQLEPLLAVLCTRRAAAREAMRRDLRSPRTGRVLEGWAEFLDRLEALPDVDRPDAARPIGALAGRRIRRVHRRMVSMGEAIGPASPPADYHELRKRAKELRYLLELFGAPLFPPGAVRPLIRSLKALQDVLGRHQDRAVQVTMLHELSEEVAARDGGAAATAAMGALVERLQADQLAARAQFAERFAPFSAKPTRRLVTEAFR